jgi:hypothetical protein
MWIVKGTLLGIWIFSFGTIAYLWLSIYRRLPPSTAVGVSVFAAYTTHNPFWWIALALSLAIGLFVTRSWSGTPALWIALVVTELFPVGLVTLFFMLVARNKEIIERMSR